MWTKFSTEIVHSHLQLVLGRTTLHELTIIYKKNLVKICTKNERYDWCRTLNHSFPKKTVLAVLMNIHLPKWISDYQMTNSRSNWFFVKLKWFEWLLLIVCYPGLHLAYEIMIIISKLVEKDGNFELHFDLISNISNSMVTTDFQLVYH